MPLILAVYIITKGYVNVSQTVLEMCIHFFTKLQNANEVVATYLLPPVI